jgi:Right handed beta helix region/Protein of unknown function (DUF1565)
MSIRQLSLVMAGLLTLLKAGSSTAPAADKTYYVSATGSDDNSGAYEHPFRTINKAVRVLKPGDTLYVRKGTYAEALRNVIPSGTSWESPVTVAASPGEEVILRPGSGEDVVKIQDNNPAYIILDGLILDATGTTAAAVFISTANGPPTVPHHIRLKNCEIKNAREQGIMVYSAPGNARQADHNEFINVKIHDIGKTKYHHGFYLNTSHNLIDHCEVWNIAGIGVQIYKTGGRGGLSCNENTIRCCKIHDTGLDTSDVTAGIVITIGSGNLICNNLIWNNYNGVQIDTGAGQTKVYNNTICKSHGDAGIRNGYPNPPGARSTIILNNILYQNKNGNKILDYGRDTFADYNLVGSTDPKFVNAAAHDFRLQANSPAIDAGTTLKEVTTDCDGVRRPQGKAYDMGAYEYASAAPKARADGPGQRKL